MPYLARLTIVLETGLDRKAIAETHRQRINTCLPRPQELRPRHSVMADIMFKKEIDGITQSPEVFAQHRTERDLVWITLLHRETVFGKEPDIDEILTTLGKLE